MKNETKIRIPNFITHYNPTGTLLVTSLGVIVAFVMIGELLIEPVVAEIFGVVTFPVKVAPDS
jgi:hypothetical protein